MTQLLTFPVLAQEDTGLWLGLHWVDWAVLCAYLLGVTAIGAWSYFKVNNMSDFFMGGRRFGKVFMMFFAFGAGTSSQDAVGVVAGTWRAGLAGIWWQFLWLWATPFYWIVAPVMRRMRALTTSDFFQARYDTSTATLYSIYGIIMSIVFIAAGLYGSGKMVNALTGGELDRVAAKLNIPVRKITLFSSPVLTQADSEIEVDLDKGEVPESVREQFLAQNLTLSPNLEVVKDQPGNWRIIDKAARLQYRVARTKVTVDGQVVEKLNIFESGWRRLQGYELAILAMTVMFVLYGMAGGLGAAIITDFVQGILTVLFSFMLLPFVFAKAGGFGNLQSQGALKPGMFDLFASGERALELAAKLNQEPITIFYVCMLSLTALAGIVVQPHIMGVCGAGKTEFEGRFGFTFGNFMKRLCTIAWTLTGMACIVWYLSPELSPLPVAEREMLMPGSETFVSGFDKNFGDALFGRAAYDILPKVAPGLIGLLMASMLAAIMSSADAQMVVSSGLFTENIYKRFMVRNRSEHHYLWAGRISGLIIVALALVLQATFADVVDALKVIIKTPAAIGISLWFGIVWRGWTPAAVWASTLAAVGTWAFVAYRPDLVAQFDMLYFMLKNRPDTTSPWQMYDAWQMFSYMTAGILVGMLVSFITPRVSREKLDHFFDLLHTPIRPGEIVNTPCTLPENPLPKGKKLLPFADIELPMPTWVGLGGFFVAWAIVGLIILLTVWLSGAI